METCTSEEAAKLITELLGSYPCLATQALDPKVETEMKRYILTLHQAIVQFPFSVSKQIVNGKTGLPSKNKIKPKSYEILAMGQEIIERQRKPLSRYAEAMRADQQRREEAWVAPTPEQKARAKILAAEFRHSVMANPRT